MRRHTRRMAVIMPLVVLAVVLIPKVSHKPSRLTVVSSPMKT